MRAAGARSSLACILSWNYVVVLGLAVTIAAIGIGFRARQAGEASLRTRYRWAVRLALGYAAVLFGSLLVAAVRFAWAVAAGAASERERAELLGVCIASAFNFVLGFLIFGMAPTLVAFMVARRLPE